MINDIDLIKKAKIGNQKAFEQLMNVYMKSIYNYILTRVSIKEDVKDVLQDVMLGAYQSLKGFKENSSIKTWLYGITRRKIADYYRLKYTKDSLTTPILVNEDYSSDDDEYEKVINKVSIHYALEKLSIDEKELIHLIFIEQLSYREIEEITEIPIGTIKSRVHSIKEKLKYLLKEDWRNTNE